MTFAIGGLAFWTPSYIYEYRGLPNLAQVNMIFGAMTVWRRYSRDAFRRLGRGQVAERAFPAPTFWFPGSE